jgi:Family of unknown function (DUF5691)
MMWQEILKIAIVGTARTALSLSARDDALGDVLSTLDANARESSLLSAAAAVALYERAGQLPAEEHQALPVPAETNDLPCCNARAAQHLSLMLSGEYKDVLPEWLAAMATAGKRVPEESLPALLALGKTNEALQEAIGKVIGKRGIWLAQQNPDWDYVVASVDESHWHTGTRNERLALLQQLRATDPTRAREFVAATWNEEKPEDRAAFIAAFITGLSLADEPFLEAALDDRRKEVRKAAADLLARLPSSALVRRMIARVTPLVTYKRKLLGKGELVVVLPQQCDKTMQRDGIEPKPPHSSMGEKGWWLEQLIRNIPPEYWLATLNQDPAELCKAARASEWQSILLGGWKTAVERDGNLRWIEALLKDQEEINQPNVFRLFDRLPTARQESFVLSNLSHDPSLLPDKVTHWLLKDHMNFIWSNEFSLQIANAIQVQLGDSETNLQLLFSNWLKKIAFKFCTDTYVQVRAKLSVATSGNDVNSSLIQDFLDISEFRHDMLKEITP